MGGILSTEAELESLDGVDIGFGDAEDFNFAYGYPIFRRKRSDGGRHVRFRDQVNFIEAPAELSAYDRRGSVDPVRYYNSHPEAYRKAMEDIALIRSQMEVHKDSNWTSRGLPTPQSLDKISRKRSSSGGSAGGLLRPYQPENAGCGAAFARQNGANSARAPFVSHPRMLF